MLLLFFHPMFSAFRWGVPNGGGGVQPPTVATWKPVIKGRRR